MKSNEFMKLYGGQKMPEFRVAPPLTVREVERVAEDARAAIGLAGSKRVPIAKVLEHILPTLIDGYEFRVEESRKLGKAEAVTDGFRPIITFGAAAYNDLLRDKPRARMTGAHEIGHLLMHTGRTGFAFLRKRDARLDPEKQADIFAAAFLMPAIEFKAMKSIRQAMDHFGVSKGAALCRARHLKLWHLLSGHRDKNSKFRNKKGHGMNRTP